MLHLSGQIAHPVRQGFGVAFDVGQGGAQLVGYVGDKILALLLGPLQLGDVGLQLLGHGVKALGKLADLIAGGDFQLPGEVALGHLLDAVGEPLEGIHHGFGQKEGEQDGDDKAQGQRLHDEGEHLGVEAADGLPAVQDIDNIGVPPPGDGNGGIHVVGGDTAVKALFPQQGGGDVGGDGDAALRRVGGTAQTAPGYAVQHKEIAVSPVYPQNARVGGQHLFQHGCGVLVVLGDGLKIPHEVCVILAKGVGELLIKVVDIVAGDGIHQKRADHHHERHDEQHHDEHQLDVKIAAHGGRLLSPVVTLRLFATRGCLAFGSVGAGRVPLAHSALRLGQKPSGLLALLGLLPALQSIRSAHDGSALRCRRRSPAPGG